MHRDPEQQLEEWPYIGPECRTGLLDSTGVMIHEGDWVALDGMTADDSMGLLPNGWMFDPGKDVYRVWWDDRCNAWGLKGLDTEQPPTTPYDVKYTNHAYGLLREPDSVTVVEAPND